MAAHFSSCLENLMDRVRESIPRQVDKKFGGPRGERGLGFSRRRKGQTLFFSTFLSLSHRKSIFL